jgi:subtilase family serine protease
MQTLLRAIGRATRVGQAVAAISLCTLNLSAQAQTQATIPTPPPRIMASIDDTQRAAIAGSRSPKARAENESGRVPGGTKLQSMNLVFQRSAQQETDLQTLIAAQQNPASPQYHQWLTPDEFGARFGMADADLAKVTLWLQQRGFNVEGVSHSKDRITFSGSVQQVEAAFATELHYYNINGQTHFAPSTEISVPAAIAPMVHGVTNLSTFKPRSHAIRRPIANFTSSQTGNHFLTPKDIYTIYDISPAYNAGHNGAGQGIAVVGQSAIVLTDIENFESAAGLAKKDPSVVLVPNSGTSTVVSGDESESDLDLEYAGAIAPGATIYFVYVGNAANMSVWNAIMYAVDNKTAPIVSTSYGDCETVYSATDYSSLNGVLAQAASQGQTVVAPSGDSGSTDCSGISGLTTAQQQALAVDFPASSQYATGMGGTEFPAADVATSASTYWTPASGSDVIGSAISYIPEQVWNDDSVANGLSAGGGGASALTSRPSWQTGVPGIASGGFRLVPDISLTASPNNAGFLYCSSDSSTKITGSCTNGFRDSSNTNLTVAGGTSFDVPIFAGMVAIINEVTNSTGQGVVNPTLYTLAANSSTYGKAFHDITSGGNQCLASATLCVAPGTTQYAAGTGYDQASGLGSIDFFELLSAWPAATTGTKSFTLSATNITVAAGSSGTATITVTPQNGYTGTISFVVSPSITNACFSIPNAIVSGSSAVAAMLTVNTTTTACASAAIKGGSGKQRNFVDATPIASRDADSTRHLRQAGTGFAALLFVVLLGFRSRPRAALSAMFLVIALSVVLAACSSSNSSSSTSPSSSTTAAKGSYTLTVVGTDTTTSATTASTTLTLTID